MYRRQRCIATAAGHSHLARSDKSAWPEVSKMLPRNSMHPCYQCHPSPSKYWCCCCALRQLPAAYVLGNGLHCMDSLHYPQQSRVEGRGHALQKPAAAAAPRTAHGKGQPSTTTRRCPPCPALFLTCARGLWAPACELPALSSRPAHVGLGGDLGGCSLSGLGQMSRCCHRRPAAKIQWRRGRRQRRDVTGAS